MRDSYRDIQNLKILHGYIFCILQHFTANLVHLVHLECIFYLLHVLFRVKELGPEDHKKGGEDYVAFDDTPDVVSPTLSSGDPAVNNADLALLCTHSVSTAFVVF